MASEHQDYEYRKSSVASTLAGLLIGAAAGAVAMLLLAPQSGQETRMKIKEKGIELRNRTTGMVEDAIEQVRAGTSKIATTGLQKAEELKQQGQELLAEQLERVSAAAQAGKKAVQAS